MDYAGTDIRHLLEKAVNEGASDIFVVAGLPITWRVNGRIHHMDGEKLMPSQTEEYVQEIYSLAGGRDMERLTGQGDDDFSFALPGLSRFRVNAYKQRGSLSVVVRVITFDLPDPEDIDIPARIIEFGNLAKGLVLVTGPAGSGKSTTLACVVNNINNTQEKHIITLEDPIEYLHRHNRSIVSQREINLDTDNYVTALRASLRQSPDVILLGEMRDYETIEVAMTAAETGHLVISTLHTIGAANTIDRIIDVFPANQQRQIAVQLSMVLQAVVSQQLVPGVDGRLVPAFEIMTVNPAIRNMIRENKVPQIDGILYSSSKPELISMDSSLLRLYREKRITAEMALAYATNPDMLSKKI
ncbi:PilT/PilU family type 4a pilus ATPase [bacterium 1XD8-76]|nr:PilT/PilU family type 4a pilus ATPase [bacterium 1XD8-76]